MYSCSLINFVNEINKVNILRLIFNNEIKFLERELGIKIPRESAFMDRMYVKVMDEECNWHIIYKIKAKDMKLELGKDSSDKLNNLNIITWYQMIENNKNRLNDLERNSIQVIEKYLELYKEHKPCVPVSGGKDSAICHHLVNLVTKEDTIFSNTSNETHHTYRYINEQYPDANKISPDEGFYTFVERTGFVPTRFGRSCCTNQKEMPMIQKLPKDDELLFFMGMRKAESNSRSQYVEEWKNHRWGNREWQGILPILEWSDLDVLLYMLDKKIPFNYLYTIGYGRVGCVNCCFRSDYELILNKEFLTSYHDRWQLILEKDFVKHKKSPTLNCDLQEYKNGAWKAGVVRDNPTEGIINEFAKQQNLDVDVAKKYFSKKCMCCNKKLKKDDIGLSMKYYGRLIEKFKCIKCLSEDLDVPKKELKENIKIFKGQGCELF